MQYFVWHKDQKAVCHCLAAVLNLATDFNQDASSYSHSLSMVSPNLGNPYFRDFLQIMAFIMMKSWMKIQSCSIAIALPKLLGSYECQAYMAYLGALNDGGAIDQSDTSKIPVQQGVRRSALG